MIRDECGVFVQTSGDHRHRGTKEAPFLSLGTAIKIAEANGTKRVYACAGSFTEEVRVPAGMTIYGGLDCTNGWQLLDGAKTTITARANAIPLRLGDASGPGGLIRLRRLQVTAQPASEPGSSSIAAVIGDVEAEIVDCSFSANSAMDGSPGSSHDALLTLGTHDGGQGSGVIIDSAYVYAGPAGEGFCDGGQTTHGGDGGEGGFHRFDENGFFNSTNPPKAGKAAGGTLGGGAGGDPLQDSLMDCDGEAIHKGENGGSGGHGNTGRGGGWEGPTRLGELHLELGYLGPFGTPGTPGTPGQGGGGGGGKAFYPTQTKSYTGASGGGGGAGGCGGKGGLAGGAGGSSIALVRLSAKPLTLTAVHLYADKAGKGGDGGSRQAGAPGGSGGEGGEGLKGKPEGKGCRGGNGGNGGNGGPGGGGAGGHSLGIATLFDSLMIVQSEDSTITIKDTNAGIGGVGEEEKANGAAGRAVKILLFTP